MPGTEQIFDIGVVLAALIGIFNQQTDGGACGLALKHAGENTHLIRLAPGCGIAGSTRTATVEILLHIGFGQLKPWRAAIDNAAECKPMAFTKSGDDKVLTYAVSRHPLNFPLEIK